ncbi:MAG: S41 family peptidase [Pseudomonadota bacterium]
MIFLGQFNLIPNANAKPSDAETLRMLDLFGDIFEKIRSDYVEEVSDEELIEASINGMLTSLDPHSSYLDKKDYNEMKVQTRGEFGGLGIEVVMENGLVKVISPFDDTPAFKAGILAGDYISHINGQPVMGMTLEEAVEKMRGPAKTKITINILRKGHNDSIKVDIIRDIIKIKSVRSRNEGNIGYIRITSFSEKTAESVEDAIKKIDKDLDKNLKGLVLDLRNNPGGLLDQAIEVSDIFLNQGEIVSTRGRMNGSTKRYNASKGESLKGIPIVTLINGGSASASEIVAGALQDHKRSIILGTVSFGKGSVQTIIPVPGEGAIKLTTSRYYTPSGNSIQAYGITPDIIVKPAKIEFIDHNKSEYKEANLPGHLLNEENANNNDKNSFIAVPKFRSSVKEQEQKDRVQKLYETDHQLARAIDLLHGIYLLNKNQSSFFQ